MKENKKIDEKIKDNNLNKIIKIIAIGILVLTFAILIIKNIDHHILKSEYTINEPGYLDKIEVTLKNVTYINQETGIELAFEITNKTDNTITIVPDEYFKFFDINEVQIPNKFDNNKSIIKKNQYFISAIDSEEFKAIIYGNEEKDFNEEKGVLEKEYNPFEKKIEQKYNKSDLSKIANQTHIKFIYFGKNMIYLIGKEKNISNFNKMLDMNLDYSKAIQQSLKEKEDIEKKLDNIKKKKYKKK